MAQNCKSVFIRKEKHAGRLRLGCAEKKVFLSTSRQINNSGFLLQLLNLDVIQFLLEGINRVVHKKKNKKILIFTFRKQHN